MTLRAWWRSLFLAILLGLAVPVAGETATDVPRCASCGEAVAGRHLVSGDRRFCSSDCFEASLPRCSACNSTIRGRHWQRSGEVFCSRDCARSTLRRCDACGEPVEKGRIAGERIYCERDAALPPCISCGLPAADGRTLTGGRQVCGECRNELIDSRARARPAYGRAATAVEEVTGRSLGELPPFRLVTLEHLLKEGRGVLGASAAGLFLSEREYSLIDGSREGPGRLVEARILLLDSQPREEFEAAAIHELTHYLMALFLPEAEKAAPQWLREGAAEYVAWIALQRAGRHDQADGLVKKPAPYGPSLAWMLERFGPDGWSDFERWLRRARPSTLPTEPPPRRGSAVRAQ